MPLCVNERVPAATLRYLEGEAQRSVCTDSLLAGRKVVMFSCVGAFGPGGAEALTLSYRTHRDALRALGVDSIVCVLVNDPYVVEAWRQHLALGDDLHLLSDAHCEHHHAVGLHFDGSSQALGWRPRPYSMLVDDGTVRLLNVAEPGAEHECAADILIQQLRARREHAPVEIPS